MDFKAGRSKSALSALSMFSSAVYVSGVFVSCFYGGDSGICPLSTRRIFYAATKETSACISVDYGINFGYGK